MSRRRAGGAIPLSSILWVGLVACSTQGESDLVLENVGLVDVTTGTVAPHDVGIRDGSITAVIPSSSGGRLSGDSVLDLSGRFLVPGFVDLHVHLPPDSLVQEEVLEQLAGYGVTTILNPGAREGAGTELRDRLGPGLPRMRTAGPIIEYLRPSQGGLDWAVTVESAAAMREEVVRQANGGVDLIKLYAGVPPELVEAAVEEASTFGLPVALHAGETLWTEAADLGVSMLVHSGYGTPMDEIVNLEDPAGASDPEWYAAYADAPSGPRFRRLVQSLVSQGVVVVPTLAITQAAGLGGDATLLPGFETHLAPEADLPGWWGEGWRDRHPQHGEVSAAEEVLLAEVYWPGVLDITRALFDAGVTLGVGTDVGNAWINPGTSFHYEMGLYAEAGIPPAEILAMATLEGARALGLADSIGTVAVGKRADLVVLSADPTRDIRATRQIEYVLIGGDFVPSAAPPRSPPLPQPPGR